MSEIQSFKCPCCGATLNFDGVSQSLHCDACDNDFSPEDLRQLSEVAEGMQEPSKFDWDHYTPRDYKEEEGDVSLSGYTCPSCGAEITGDDSLGATVCPYCGSATIIKSQFEGNLCPDYIIPFRVDKKAAIAAFEADFVNAPFLPDLFKEKKRISEMTGVYVPFWMFDCDCDAQITYKGERITTWSDSRYHYTKTDFYRLYRSGRIAFENIPVDASQKADDAYMDAVEPFDYADAVNFNSAYLSGYLAEKYDVSAEDSAERANARVLNSTAAAFMETTQDYAGVTQEDTNVRFSGGKIRYSLLPVWMLHIKYQDKMYQFAINGQTGKVVGEYPVDKGKKWKYFAKIAGIGYVLAAAVAWLLLR